MPRGAERFPFFLPKRVLPSHVHVLIVTPVIWTMLKERELKTGRLEAGRVSQLLKT